MTKEVRVKVRTNTKNEQVVELPDGRFEISVRAKPEGGFANERVRELLAAHFQVSLENVHIVRGSTTPSKTVRVVSALSH
jgi:uncharacterized protein YggU (UPF0235/DUF167 family)